MFGGFACGVGLFGGDVHFCFPFFYDPDSDEEDIAALEGDVAFCCDFQNFGEFDGVLGEGCVFDALLFGP